MVSKSCGPKQADPEKRKWYAPTFLTVECPAQLPTQCYYTLSFAHWCWIKHNSRIQNSLRQCLHSSRWPVIFQFNITGWYYQFPAQMEFYQALFILKKLLPYPAFLTVLSLTSMHCLLIYWLPVSYQERASSWKTDPLSPSNWHAVPLQWIFLEQILFSKA